MVLVLGAACSRLPSLPKGRESEPHDVALTADIVAGVWVGHVSGAVYTFKTDSTFDAVGVPRATFEDSSVPIGGAAGPFHCRGAWRIAEDRHLLVLDMTAIVDEHDKQPYPQGRSVTFGATQWISDPPDDPVQPIKLGHGQDGMSKR